MGGFYLNLGEAGRAGVAGIILQGVLPVPTLPGSLCKEEKDYSTLLLIIPVLKGFFGLSRQQFWQEVSQAQSWQLWGKGWFIQDIKIQGDGFELKLMQEKDKKEISLWAQQLLQRQQGKFVERRLSSEKSFFPDCRIPVWKEET